MPKQSLQKLQAKWYRKLESTGFKDIEDDKGRLKNWTGYLTLENENAEILSGHHKRESSKVQKISQAEYYRLAGQMLYDQEFPNKQYKQVWKLHVEGKSYSEIAKLMGFSKFCVQYRVCKMRRL